ncbi:hypothetical protein [Variovorax guangxiensis]|uniref:hypothetical protein n=1 Tax=Variovorax guangxiensis TaxID=1775474 RepID=UPI002855F13E|nr:hypothetical protein [Variovorax guangxiensis]MDR6855296.1 hypothetical protein [Variovorax guangxiensis]
MPKTAAERNRTYRKRLAEKGSTSICITVDGATARRLRAMAREHQQTMGSVLQLASLLAQRALAEPKTRVAE